MEKRVPRDWSVGREIKQRHILACDGVYSRERSVASEAPRSTRDDTKVTDVPRSIRTMKWSMERTNCLSSKGPRSFLDSAMVRENRPQSSISSSCYSLRSSVDPTGRTRRGCGRVTCGSNLKCRREVREYTMKSSVELFTVKIRLLCAACHDMMETALMHLGKALHAVAMTWMEICHSTGAGLPALVYPTFMPFISCLCSRTSHFHRADDCAVMQSV